MIQSLLNYSQLMMGLIKNIGSDYKFELCQIDNITITQTRNIIYSVKSKFDSKDSTLLY